MSPKQVSFDFPVIENAPLSKFTTFQIGGPSRGIIPCQKPEDLIDITSFLREKQLPYILIGGGSNLVVSDQGIDSYVIRYLAEEPLVEKLDQFKIQVSASTLLDSFVQWAAENSLNGINYCSGIPGTVGGAVVGNAGAFGKQIGDRLISARIITSDGEIKTVDKKYFDFSYRHSKVKESGDIVIDIVLQLENGSSEELLNERDEILKIRAEKHPHLQTTPCAGSFFRNIEPTSSAEKRQAAGWFLDQAGGKDLSCGGAQIFDKHANIIVKGPNCTSEDIYALHLKMKQIVKEKFDLDLVREVRFVGSFENQKDSGKAPIW